MRTNGRLMVAVVMLSGVILLPAVASGSPEPNVEICHFNADNDPNAPEWELLVVNNNSVAEKHLAHGDGVPEGEVPGTDGEYVFDENCVPQLAELILAVAYTDIDPDDGPYDPSIDVLIAKLVDGPNGDEVLSAGDLVATDQYPKNRVADSFGNFQVTEHEVSAVVVSLSTRCLIVSESGLFAWSDLSNGEVYQEFPRNADGTINFSLASTLQDGLVELASEIVSLKPESPSQPEDSISDLAGGIGIDEPFLDVETSCAS